MSVFVVPAGHMDALKDAIAATGGSLSDYADRIMQAAVNMAMVAEPGIEGLCYSQRDWNGVIESVTDQEGATLSLAEMQQLKSELAGHSFESTAVADTIKTEMREAVDDALAEIIADRQPNAQEVKG